MEVIQGKIIDVVNQCIYYGEVQYADGFIKSIKRIPEISNSEYILPGLIDAHIHIESSMLVPARFAEAVIKHGTVATVSDPHEIANVLGLEGIRFMIDNAATVPVKFYFGAPSCVPATPFESSGSVITSDDIKELLAWDEIKYLSEMMNFPGVINNDAEVHKKLAYAKEMSKPVDGHAPGLRGEDLKKYVMAGIQTDHECSSIEEAREKLELGMMILIREGSAARNLEVLYPLIDSHPDKVMLCSDDLHPDQLIKGHINHIIKKALEKGMDLFHILRAATYNPAKFYRLDTGLLQIGDPADFIVIDDLDNWKVLKTYINGVKVYDGDKPLFDIKQSQTPNFFYKNEIDKGYLQVPETSSSVRIIEAMDGELITNQIIDKPKSENGFYISDTKRDILKIVVQNRYEKEKPSIGFIHNFGLKYGGMISTIAHDSHNIICIATNDEVICRLLEWVNENRGGIAFSDGSEIWGIPLPIAGIMSNEPAETIAEKYYELEEAVKAAGSKLKSPFMTLSFMSLLVIPHLKLGNKGLFDVNSFKFVDIYAE